MPLSYDARGVFSLFSMKYMGSCPLNRKLFLWNCKGFNYRFVNVGGKIVLLWAKCMKKCRFESLQKVQRWYRTFSPPIYIACINYKEKFYACVCTVCLLCFLCEMLCDFILISLNQHIIFVFRFPKRIFENKKIKIKIFNLKIL